MPYYAAEFSWVISSTGSTTYQQTKPKSQKIMAKKKQMGQDGMNSIKVKQKIINVQWGITDNFILDLK